MTDRTEYDGDPTYGATITVVDVDRAGKVTSRGEDGARFSVIIRQKPNPIGFTAKFNGSRK